MATLELTDANFRETVSNNPVIVLDFWAPWCAPCRAFGPIFEEVSDQFPDVVFGKINTEQEPKLAGYFGIRSIPTLIVIREQIVIDQTSGVLPADRLAEAVRQVKALDMDEVRRQVDEEQKSE